MAKNKQKKSQTVPLLDITAPIISATDGDVGQLMNDDTELPLLANPTASRMMKARVAQHRALFPSEKVHVVAAHFGFNRTTLWRWERTDREYQELYSKACDRVLNDEWTDVIDYLRSHNAEMASELVGLTRQQRDLRVKRQAIMDSFTLQGRVKSPAPAVSKVIVQLQAQIAAEIIAATGPAPELRTIDGNL